MEKRKQVTFDLNQALLKEHYPKKRPTLNPQYYKHAYDEIKRYMLKNGFEWIQQSVYVSKEPMSVPQIVGFMMQMAEKMPWLHVCANDIVATDVISKKYKLKPYMERAVSGRQKDLELVSKSEMSNLTETRKPSLMSVIEDAQRRSQAQSHEKGRNPQSLNMER